MVLLKCISNKNLSSLPTKNGWEQGRQPNKEKKEDIAVLAMDEDANQIFKVHVSDNEIITAVSYKLTNSQTKEMEIPDLIKMIQKEKQSRQEDRELRYIPSTLQFINMKIYKL